MEFRIARFGSRPSSVGEDQLNGGEKNIEPTATGFEHEPHSHDFLFFWELASRLFMGTEYHTLI
jgi:hypothetical protein